MKHNILKPQILYTQLRKMLLASTHICTVGKLYTFVLINFELLDLLFLFYSHSCNDVLVYLNLYRKSNGIHCLFTFKSNSFMVLSSHLFNVINKKLECESYNQNIQISFCFCALLVKCYSSYLRT